MITEKKKHKCKENGRHAAMLEIPERAYEDCRVSLWGDDSRSYNVPGLIPISPIHGEIHVFPTHGTFL